MKPSTFVRCLSWAVILLSVLSILLCAHTLIAASCSEQPPTRGSERLEGQHALEGAMYVSTFAELMFRVALLTTVLCLAAAILGLVAGVGLLKRKNWARRLLSGLLTLGVMVTVFLFIKNLHFETAVGPVAALACLLQGIVLVSLQTKGVRSEFES